MNNIPSKLFIAPFKKLFSITSKIQREDESRSWIETFPTYFNKIWMFIMFVILTCSPALLRFPYSGATSLLAPPAFLNPTPSLFAQWVHIITICHHLIVNGLYSGIHILRGNFTQLRTVQNSSLNFPFYCALIFFVNESKYKIMTCDELDPVVSRTDKREYD